MCKNEVIIYTHTFTQRYIHVYIYIYIYIYTYIYNLEKTLYHLKIKERTGCFYGYIGRSSQLVVGDMTHEEGGMDIPEG